LSPNVADPTISTMPVPANAISIQRRLPVPAGDLSAADLSFARRNIEGIDRSTHPDSALLRDKIDASLDDRDFVDAFARLWMEQHGSPYAAL
jgi:hypothetical protein